MIGRALALLPALLASEPATAGLARSDLDRVTASPAADARVPLDLDLVEAPEGRPTTLARVLDGRPTLLLPVDFKCRNLCDPMASMLVSAARATGLPPDSFTLAFVGLDPRDDLAAASRQLAAIREGQGADVAPRTVIAAPAPLANLLRALGYTAIYDAETDSFAHPAVAMLLTRDGRVARALSPLALTGGDLRLALVEAGEGRIGGIRDQLALICYGFDAAQGIYTPAIRRILMWGGALCLLALALFLVALHRVARAPLGPSRATVRAGRDVGGAAAHESSAGGAESAAGRPRS